MHQKLFGNIFCYKMQFFIIGKNLSNALTYKVIVFAMLYVVDTFVLHVYRPNKPKWLNCITNH